MCNKSDALVLDGSLSRLELSLNAGERTAINIAFGSADDVSDCSDREKRRHKKNVQAVFAKIIKHLKYGEGIVYIRGVHIRGMDERLLGQKFLGFTSTIGRPVSQSVLGDKVGRVEDRTEDDPGARGYRNNCELKLHTDQPDVIALLCVRPAVYGGRSYFADALALHKQISNVRPDLMEALYEGFPYHKLNEQAEGESEITDWSVPIFSRAGGEVSVRYIRYNMEIASQVSGIPMPKKLISAMDYLDRLAVSDSHLVSGYLAEGDIVLINNYTWLHGRDEFQDEHAGGKRLMFRVWLHCRKFRNVSDKLAIHSNGCTSGRGEILRQAKKTPNFEAV